VDDPSLARNRDSSTPFLAIQVFNFKQFLIAKVIRSVYTQALLPRITQDIPQPKGRTSSENRLHTPENDDNDSSTMLVSRKPRSEATLPISEIEHGKLNPTSSWNASNENKPKLDIHLLGCLRFSDLGWCHGRAHFLGGNNEADVRQTSSTRQFT
jgi:hypothetical protein